MKKLFLLALPALMASCSSKEFKIEGTITEQLDSTYAYLMTDREEILDSCLINNGALLSHVNEVNFLVVHRVGKCKLTLVYKA